MNSEQLLIDLEDIVNRGLEDSLIPYARGNSIRIKHVVIRKSPNGYLIYNTKENKQVARTYFKVAAVAIAKNLAQGKNVINKVLPLDIEMLKHYNDSIFYKHLIQKTRDNVTRDIRRIRLDIAVDESRRIRNLLDKFIF